jgi:hypothetical protein
VEVDRDGNTLSLFQSQVTGPAGLARPALVRILLLGQEAVPEDCQPRLARILAGLEL